MSENEGFPIRRWCLYHIILAFDILCKMLSYFYCFSVFQGEKTIQIRYTWTRILWKTEKTITFLKNIWIHGDRALIINGEQGCNGCEQGKFRCSLSFAGKLKFNNFFKRWKRRIYEYIHLKCLKQKRGSLQKDLRFEPLSHPTNLKKCSVLINNKK